MFTKQRRELTGRELHEAEVLARLQRCRRAHEEATRVVAHATATLESAKRRQEEIAELLADSLRETRRVTQS